MKLTPEEQREIAEKCGAVFTPIGEVAFSIEEFDLYTAEVQRRTLKKAAEWFDTRGFDGYNERDEIIGYAEDELRRMADEIKETNMNVATEASKFAVPQLNEGELYVGAIINPDGTGHHIILLPGDNDDADWQAQMDWAKSIGGDLPSRVEQAILFDKFRDRFQSDYYWSNQQHESCSSFVWGQDFDSGNQSYWDKLINDRARAVRRVAI